MPTPAMNDAKTHYMAGLKHFGANRFEEAISEYRLALEAKPDWAELYNAIATAEAKLNRLDEAVATIHKAIELDPNDAFFFTSLSIFLPRQGKVPEAEAAAAKARMISWKEELKKNPNAPPPGPAGGMNVVQ
jgi:Flp pilus assembly protein TadD